MPRVIQSPREFTIIGENIHATRVVQRGGRRATTLEDGREVVPFKGGSGEDLYLVVPENFKTTQAYQQGQIKHVMIAVAKGLSDGVADRAEGRAYIQYEVRRQLAAGANFLDLNVDEVSYHVDIQKKAIAWLVRTVQEVSHVPPSVDSSKTEIIAAGLAEYDGRAGRPMVNSLALERLEVLELVKRYNARVIVTAAGLERMPQGAQERVANVGRLMEAVLSSGVPLGDVYVDALVFPIAVSSMHGCDYLDAVRQLRKTYGTRIHITGGLSNVSFGLPKRSLINDTFIYLALEAGIDSGIIDPIQSRIADIFNLDVNSGPVRLAAEALLGQDDMCINYIQAWRDGRLQ